MTAGGGRGGSWASIIPSVAYRVIEASLGDYYSSARVAHTITIERSQDTIVSARMLERLRETRAMMPHKIELIPETQLHQSV